MHFSLSSAAGQDLKEQISQLMIEEEEISEGVAVGVQFLSFTCHLLLKYQYTVSLLLCTGVCSLDPKLLLSFWYFFVHCVTKLERSLETRLGICTRDFADIKIISYNRVTYLNLAFTNTCITLPLFSYTGWDKTVHAHLVALASNPVETLWPRDTLFKYCNGFKSGINVIFHRSLILISI